MRLIVDSNGPVHRIASALFLCAFAGGCGSGAPGNASQPSGVKGAAAKIKPEQLWKYEGTGAAKHKVQLSQRERVNLLHQAGKKTD